MAFWKARSEAGALRKAMIPALCMKPATEPIEVESAKWLQQARELLSLVGSQNKLAKLLGVSRSYLGRVLSGEKPIKEELGVRVLRESRNNPDEQNGN